ncbi:acyltransferase [Lampropedia aestuarii]|uniref:Acyltransferase n=1 Tax=Lampropedia aestuarii TaxID=2562762 RepID=A0A4S5BST0_9BURK|nr:acyltransferase [Lampropedia aestuarii]THJ35670.1 acyltransferase [Lampropedia aestuarii]
MSNTSQKKIELIECIRGIAALAVVLCHTRYYVKDLPSGYIAEALFYPGAMGVDIFFIISGFIITHTTINSPGGTNSALSFITKRIIRVWPSYTLATLAFLIILYNGFSFFSTSENIKSFIKSIFFLPVDVSNSPFYFGMPFGIAWTLIFEFYFYSIFAISLLFGRFRYLALASWITVSLILIPLYRNNFSFDAFNQAASIKYPYISVMTSPMVWEFIAGIIIALIYHSTIRIKSTVVLYNIVFLSFGLALWAFSSGLSWNHGPANWGWPLIILFLSLIFLIKEVDIKTPAALVWMGKISFSLYLTHMIVLTITQRLMTSLGSSFYNSWSHIVIATTLSITFAALWYYHIETPSSKLMQKFLWKISDRLSHTPK